MRSILVIFLFIILASCQQSTNSNSNDELLFAPSTNTGDESTDELTLYQKTDSIIKTNCASCHTGYHSAWNTSTEDELIEALEDDYSLDRGNSSGSPLILDLAQWGTGTMPKDRAPISESDYEILKDWIDSLEVDP